MIISDKTRNILEWIFCIVIAFVLAIVIKYYVGTPTIVSQVSMKPTLQSGQRLILNRWMRTIHEMPKRGEIITFEAPSKVSYSSSAEVDLSNPVAKYEKEPTSWWGKFVYYVLEIGKENINGEELDEPYLQKGVVTQASYETSYSNYNYFSEFTVPEGYIFAMGDNRSQSTDCRAFGCIPVDKVESKVWIRFWPFSLFGKV